MDGNPQDVRVDLAHSTSNNHVSEGAAYWRIWRMTQSPDYDPDEVVPLIMQHQRIAERMLRVANSLTTNIKREITSVRHAVLMIGSRGVNEFSRPNAVQFESTPEGRAIRTDAAETNAPMGMALRSSMRESD